MVSVVVSVCMGKMFAEVRKMFVNARDAEQAAGKRGRGRRARNLFRRADSVNAGRAVQVRHDGNSPARFAVEPWMRNWVYRRRGHPCFVCAMPIEMFRQGDFQRTTYFCPHCQPTISRPANGRVDGSRSSQRFAAWSDSPAGRTRRALICLTRQRPQGAQSFSPVLESARDVARRCQQAVHG